MADALIALGSNLGNRSDTLDRAVALLSQQPGIQVNAKSRWHTTSPVGGPNGQDDFLNGAIRVETTLSPEALFSALAQIEADLGRERGERWAARTIDLDLLLYDETVLDTPDLIVPHPRMSFRRFVLEPAVEIAAPMRHPTIGWTLGELLSHLDKATNYIAITGIPGAGKSRLAEQIQERLAACLILDPPELAAGGPNPGNPASQRGDREIRFLRRRAAQLDPKEAPTSPQTYVVSDFWFGQSLAYGKLWLDAPRRALLDQHWDSTVQTVLLPKLLVLVDVPVAVAQERLAESGQNAAQPLTSQQLRSLQTALNQCIGNGGHGPLLQVDGTDLDRALQETLAAIEAMA